MWGMVFGGLYMTEAHFAWPLAELYELGAYLGKAKTRLELNNFPTNFLN